MSSQILEEGEEEKEQEQEQEQQLVPVPTRMPRMLSSQSQQSRLQRLSSFLSPLGINSDSKLLKDIPRKRAPSPYQIQTSIAAPSRPPPPTPQPLSQPVGSPPPPPPFSSHQPRHTSSPSQPSPRDQSRSPRSSPDGRRARGNSLLPPTSPDVGQGRSVSSPLTPQSYYSEGEDGGSRQRRKSWMPGSRSRSRNSSQDLDQQLPAAWVNAGAHKIEYNIKLLLNGEKVPELWDESKGDTFIYLFGPNSPAGPSFRVPSMILSSSQTLITLVYQRLSSGRSRAKSFNGRESLAVEDATRNLPVRNLGTPPYTPKFDASDAQSGSTQSSSNGSRDSIQSFPDAPREIHFYFPSKLTTSGPHFQASDVYELLSIRNLFAFLTGQPLVSTPSCPSTFHAFLSAAKKLQEYEFTNFDGSTYGEAATTSFDFFLDELRFADVRESREKTVEGIVLGENMRSAALFNEAYSHAVGKYKALEELKLPIFNEISSKTRTRLEIAAAQLAQRQRMVDEHLTDFAFASMFSGIGCSTTAPEAKIVRFNAWKKQFANFRSFLLGYYKNLHGHWPPKASSRKNNFAEGGLNRLVLKGLYADLCGLYNYLVNSKAKTNRVYEASDDRDATDASPEAAALRKLLGEFDRSIPPVKPPIPFDVPLLPSIEIVEVSYSQKSPKEQHKDNTRKLKEHETLLILAKTHNLAAEIKTPFLDSYKAFESKEASGKSFQELVDQRFGYWVLLYAIIQMLPLLVVDAPDLKFTDGVEYFLCIPPMGGHPWMEGETQNAWFAVQGGQSLTKLPTDQVNYGVEGTYHRSHCWVVGQNWLDGIDHSAPINQVPTGMEALSPLAPPPSFLGGELALRPSARGRERSASATGLRTGGLSPGGQDRNSNRQSKRQSIALGLERLPIPAGEEHWLPAANGSHSRTTSRGASPIGFKRPQSIGSDIQTPTSGGTIKGSTFDDILGSIQAEGGGDGGKKKRSIW